MTLSEITHADEIAVRVRTFVDAFLDHPCAKAHLYPFTWLSGSNAEVTPVEIYSFGGGKFRVTFQWDCAKRIFDKFIDRIVTAYSPLVESGHFIPYDGSRPAEIVFVLDGNKVA